MAEKKKSVRGLLAGRMSQLQIAVDKQTSGQGGTAKAMEGGKATSAPANKATVNKTPPQPANAAQVKRQEDEAARLMRNKELMDAQEGAKKLQDLFKAFGSALGGQRKKETLKKKSNAILGPRG